MIAAPSRKHISLNGMWDFCPVLSEDGKTHLPPPQSPPELKWHEGAVSVPGSWSRGGSVLGENDDLDAQPWLGWRIFDNYGLPEEWDATCTAWYRCRFNCPVAKTNDRWVLHFGGVLRCAWVFVNGQCIGHIPHGIMPGEFDVTDVVHDGENELHVYVTEYPTADDGNYMLPIGLDQVTEQKGIWQDVVLRRVPAIHIADVTIRSSVRENRLSVLMTLSNTLCEACDVKPSCVVRDGDRACLSFSGSPVTVPAGKAVMVSLDEAWTSSFPWSPSSPQLYHLDTTLRGASGPVDGRTDRFGFREVWIEGPHVMLNDAPIHMSGDWCHKSNMDNFRPEYIRQWFRMLKDANMNYIRTHMFPHPPHLLDLADEMGILVSLESAFAFGRNYAMAEEAFWENSLRHVRDIVRRDKNHPSIIFWSVANEARWSGQQRAVIDNLPRLYDLYEELDPTRIPYYDGDSSLWDERKQHLLSRHYGFSCTGEGSWDKTQPLHVGEIGKWHYAQPIDNAVWGDDSIFSSAADCYRAVAREAADMMEQARANEVACLFPWNLSGLDNYRPWPEEHTFTWEDTTAPHVKPLRSAPYGSEFAWWDADSPGYAPGVGFPVIRDALRPLAVIVREKLGHAYDDQEVSHSVTVVNDSGAAVQGVLRVCLRCKDGSADWSAEQALDVGKGRVGRAAFHVPLSATRGAAQVEIVTTYSHGRQILDEHIRVMRITPANSRTESWGLSPIAVFGDGSMDDLLAAHECDSVRITTLSDVNIAQTPVLLIEKNAVQPGSNQHRELESFVQAGGRAIVLEQDACILPGLRLEQRPVEQCHIRAGMHDVLAGFDADDFAYWGNSPYGCTPSDAWVAVSPYSKPNTGNNRMLLHSGGGDFGNGGLFWTPLLETRVGSGVILACQLRVTEKAGTHPVARRLIRQFITHAQSWEAAPYKTVATFDEAGVAALAERSVTATENVEEAELVVGAAAELTAECARALALRVRQQGVTAVLMGLDKTSAALIADVFAVEIQTVDLGLQHCLMRASDNPLLEGISNQETFWIQSLNYAGIGAANPVMTDTLLRCPEGASVLLSESESCWREFFVYGAMSENYRMPVLTHYLWDGPREHAAGLVRFTHGKGALILCQLPFPDEVCSRHSHVFWAHFLRNLGAELCTTLLDGDAVGGAGQRSEGYPDSILVMNDASEALREKVFHAAAPQGEWNSPNHLIISSFDWDNKKGLGGVLPSGENVNERLGVFQVHAGRPRSAVPVAGGWPDPTQQTLLDLSGGGDVTIHVNGKTYQTVELGEHGRGTVADIDLHMGWNTVVVQWRPGGSGLRFQWRNRQGEPEVEFEFVSHPWDA